MIGKEVRIMTSANTIPTQDNEVKYRKAKLWQIIFIAFNAFNGMAVYFLIGLASYSASIGYGIATLIVGGLLTFTRIFDAVTDPLLAFLYDRVNTRWGKVRPLMLLGWAIQTIGLLCMFNFFSSKGHGVPVFLLFYMAANGRRVADSAELSDPHGAEHHRIYETDAGYGRQFQSGIPECGHMDVRWHLLRGRGPGVHRGVRVR